MIVPASRRIALVGLVCASRCVLHSRADSHQTTYADRATTFLGGVPILSRAEGVQEWLVMLRSGTGDEQAHALCSTQVPCSAHGSSADGGVGFVTVTANTDQLEKLLENRSTEILFAEQNIEVSLEPEPPSLPSAAEADTDSDVPWGLDRIDDRQSVDGSYVPKHGGKGVHVYVLDTGIRTTHEDFLAPDGTRRAVPTLDTTLGSRRECQPSDLSCAVDGHGHGTHCAGTIGGKKFGVAKGAWLHAVKVLTDEGGGTLATVLSGMDWVAMNSQKPAVVSMSLGGTGSYATYDFIVRALTERGIPVVAAAGNDFGDACHKSPAAVPLVITVGATALVHPDSDESASDEIAEFSNHGTCVDLFAPGVGIKSAGITSDSSSRVMSGTSMACPHVAGATALLMEEYPTRTPAEISELLVVRGTHGAIAGLDEFTKDTLLYVGDEPPMTTTTQTTTMPDFRGHAWRVAKGSCLIDDAGCALSSRYPKQYLPNEECEIVINETALGRISYVDFGIDDGDRLVVNGVTYFGDSRFMDGPLNVIPKGTITWSTDSYYQYRGWKLCMEFDYTTTLPPPDTVEPTTLVGEQWLAPRDDLLLTDDFVTAEQFEIELDVLPKGVVKPWANLFRFTTRNDEKNDFGSHMPGLYFTGGTTCWCQGKRQVGGTCLAAFMGQHSHHSAWTYTETDCLPIGEVSHVKISLTNDFIVYSNGTEVMRKEGYFLGDRYAATSGVKVWLGRGKYHARTQKPADVEIRRFIYKPIGSPTTTTTTSTSYWPTLRPTSAPTSPTKAPTTVVPTPAPTNRPMDDPPTHSPTHSPTAMTAAPTPPPTVPPTALPTPQPTPATLVPTLAPSLKPTAAPTATPTASDAADTLLAAYWDNGECGPHGNNHNWEWCDRWNFRCQKSVAVSTDICTSGRAVLASTKTFISVRNCTYAYYAQYECEVLDARLAAYWDYGSCGPHGDNHNWDWCGMWTFSCPKVRTVPTELCASGIAVLVGTKYAIQIDSCPYAYYAQYACGDADVNSSKRKEFLAP